MSENYQLKEKTIKIRRFKEQNNNLIKINQRICYKCEHQLDIILFNKNAKMPNGYQLYCKKCRYQSYVAPRMKEICEKVKQWQKKNPEKHKEYIKKSKSTLKLRNKIRQYIKKKMKTYLFDTISPYRLKYRNLIGCSSQELQIYLESKFTTEMLWDNYGTIWHIDHIIPLAAFDFTKKEHLTWCANFKNLQPLIGSLNSEKSDYICGESIRRLKTELQFDKLNNLIGLELERLQITNKVDYLNSLQKKEEIIYINV